MVSLIFLDHENSCGFGVKFILHSLSGVHPWMAAGFPKCPALETMQSHSLRHLLKQFIESHCHQVSHGNLDLVDIYCREQPLGRQPTWLLSMDGSERECVFYGFGKNDN